MRHGSSSDSTYAISMFDLALTNIFLVSVFIYVLNTRPHMHTMRITYNFSKKLTVTSSENPWRTRRFRTHGVTACDGLWWGVRMFTRSRSYIVPVHASRSPSAHILLRTISHSTTSFIHPIVFMSGRKKKNTTKTSPKLPVGADGLNKHQRYYQKKKRLAQVDLSASTHESPSFTEGWWFKIRLNQVEQSP